MASVYISAATPPSLHLNVADRLAHIAVAMPEAVAVACPHRSSPGYRTTRQGNSGAHYATITFEELDADATRLAGSLLAWGVPPGTRLALLVRPGIDFVALVFALLRAGMVIVLIDPGLGRRNLIRCLEEVQPEGFVATGVAQAARLLLRHKFPHARWNVTIGRRWFWGGLTLSELRTRGVEADLKRPNSSPRAPRYSLPATHPDDPAAIVFTSGSTGPPKGVRYTHRMFDTQVAEIQSTYGIEPGGIDLACFPLFALFNSAMGVATVLPEMNFSRPASADPRRLIAAANDWQVTQAFASPAVWRMIGEHCETTGERIPSLRQVFSCGAPVPADVLRATLACVAEGAKMHTPYGATECLPVATIEAAEVLAETAALTEAGAGICVGRKFQSVDWRIIRITDEPIATMDDAEQLPPGEIGELIVRAPQASPCYVTRTQCNAEAKIMHQRAGSSTTPAWHRMGDVGYLDDQHRFWYCGRKSQRVETVGGPMFTECVEAIFNAHPAVLQSALVSMGPRGRQTPVLVIQRDMRRRINIREHDFLDFAKSRASTRLIGATLFHSSLPVDVRHNAKINREQLAAWAAKQLARRLQPPAPSP